jgi:hypothetical protein
MSGVALLFVAATSHAGTIRVTAIDLQHGGDPGFVPKTAAYLNGLKPDLIVLQHMTDWNSCQQLAQALQPENYQVVTCSAFQKAHLKSAGEVAILSKRKAYLAWSEPWHEGGGGFAFAALRLAGKNVGIFSVDGTRQGNANSEFTRQIDSLRKWEDNQVQTLIVAGDWKSNQAGFENTLATESSPEAVYSRGAGLVIPISSTQTTMGDAVTFDFDPNAPASARHVPPLVRSPEKPPAYLWWTLGLLGVTVVVFVLKRQPRQNLQLQTIDTAVISPIVRDGVARQLREWLKQKFVQRLISDRAQLIATQQAATIKIMAVDERLTKIESQIQQRHQEYEQRIDQLVAELNDAREENRELIRAKIALVKIEMEKARLRDARQAERQQQY